MPSDQDRPVPTIAVGPPPAPEEVPQQALFPPAPKAGPSAPPSAPPPPRAVAVLTVGAVVEGPHMSPQVAGAYPLWRGVRPFRAEVVSISPEGVCRAKSLESVPEPRPRHLDEDGTFTFLPRFWSLLAPPEPARPRDQLNLEAQALGFRLIAWPLIQGEADRDASAYLAKVREVVRRQAEVLGWPPPAPAAVSEEDKR